MLVLVLVLVLVVPVVPVVGEGAGLNCELWKTGQLWKKGHLTQCKGGVPKLVGCEEACTRVEVLRREKST